MNVRLPRFRISAASNVDGGLKRMGVTDIFDEDKADLQLMAPNKDVYLTSIAHK